MEHCLLTLCLLAVRRWPNCTELALCYPSSPPLSHTLSSVSYLCGCAVVGLEYLLRSRTRVRCEAALKAYSLALTVVVLWLR